MKLATPRQIAGRAYQRVRKDPVLRKLYNAYLRKAPFDSPENAPAINALRWAFERVAFSNWHLAYTATETDQSELPEIDIVGVMFNNSLYLDEFFGSLVNGTFPSEKINLCLVDNGSDPYHLKYQNSICEKYKSCFKSLSVSRSGNVGYGMGCDVGIRQTSSEFVLVTNIDVRYDRGALAFVVDFAVRDEEDVACWEFRQRPYEHPKYYDPITLLTNWCSHAAVLFRRSAYESSGGYDRAIFMYGEDVELSYRLRLKGWKLRYVPKATVRHDVKFEASGSRNHQLSGSLAASVLLRNRYMGKKSADAMQNHIRRLLKLESDPDRKRSFETALKLVEKNHAHFRKVPNPHNIYFPFRAFDYEMRRDGHDYRSDGDISEWRDPPLVTVVTRTVGTRLKLLEEAILSVIGQTYPNIEHIIVEDGGNNTQSLVKELRDAYDRDIKYFSIPKKGRSSAGNFGFAKASGQYLMTLDDDDILYADHIEILADKLRSEIDSVAAYSLAWAVETEYIEDEQYIEHLFVTPDAHKLPFDRDRLRAANFIPIQAILFRKSLFDAFGGFHEEMDCLEDWNLWHRYSLLGRFSFAFKTTSIYRIPRSTNEQIRRQEIFDKSYKYASEKNSFDIDHILSNR